MDMMDILFAQQTSGGSGGGTGVYTELLNITEIETSTNQIDVIIDVTNE